MIRRRRNSCERRPASRLRILPINFSQNITSERKAGEIIECEQAGTQAVINIVGIISDVVGNGRRLRLGTCKTPELQVLAFIVFGDFAGNSVFGIANGRPSGAVDQRSVVLDQPFERFPRQIKAVEGRVAPLQPRNDRQCLSVVVEAAPILEAARKCPLTGMSKWRMSEVVTERGGLRQVLVEREGAGERARNLRHFERVGQTSPVVVAFVIDEHLRLVAQAPKRRRMNEAIAVAPEVAAGRAGRLWPKPAAGGPGIGRKRRTPAVARHAALFTLDEPWN